MDFWHRAWIPYHFGGSPTSCLDPLPFRWLSSIVFGSPIVSAALRHLVLILYRFQRFSDIMPGYPIISVTLRHRVRIPYHFSDSPKLCPDSLLLFQLLFDIMPGSLIFSTALQYCVRISYRFSGSPGWCSDPFFFFLVLRHHVGISNHFDDSLISCWDPLSFQRLSGIVPGFSPIVSAAL